MPGHIVSAGVESAEDELIHESQYIVASTYTAHIEGVGLTVGADVTIGEVDMPCAPTNLDVRSRRPVVRRIGPWKRE